MHNFKYNIYLSIPKYSYATILFFDEYFSKYIGLNIVYRTEFMAIENITLENNYNSVFALFLSLL